MNGQLGTAVIGLVLCLPSMAHASEPCEPVCSCEHIVSTEPDFYQEGFGIPTNARLFVPVDVAAPAIRLEFESQPGTAIPITIEEEAPNGAAVWVRPDAELDPDTAYVILVADTQRTMFFSTGSGPDTNAPDLIGASSQRRPDGESCDPFVGFTITSPSLPTNESQSLVQVVVATPDEADQVWFFDAFHGRMVLGASRDGSECATSESSRATLPDAAAGQILTVTVTLFDAAGNPSTESVLTEVAVQESAAGDPEEMSGACSCVCRSAGADPGSSTSPRWAFIALGVLLGRRFARYRGCVSDSHPRYRSVAGGSHSIRICTPVGVGNGAPNTP